MKEHEIFLNDWVRIFAGEAPPAFYGELVLRTSYIFLLLLICMRLLGKRMAAQLSRNDMAAMVSMAAAIGVPVLAYDRGLLPSTIIAVVVVLIARFSANLNHRNVKMEKLTIGDVSIIVEDGIINQKEILMSKLPRERVLADLRSQSVIHLGEVKRLYMESNGDFSLIRNPQPGQGLLAIPENDEEFVEMMTERTDTEICLQCGTEINQRNNGNGEKKCSNCGSQVFTYAVRKK